MVLQSHPLRTLRHCLRAPDQKEAHIHHLSLPSTDQPCCPWCTMRSADGEGVLVRQCQVEVKISGEISILLWGSLVAGVAEAKPLTIDYSSLADRESSVRSARCALSSAGI